MRYLPRSVAIDTDPAEPNKILRGPESHAIKQCVHRDDRGTRELTSHLLRLWREIPAECVALSTSGDIPT